MSGMAGSHQMLGREAWGRFSPRGFAGNVALLIPWYQTSSILCRLREYIFVVLSPQFVGICYSSPRKPTYKTNSLRVCSFLQPLQPRKFVLEINPEHGTASSALPDKGCQCGEEANSSLPRGGGCDRRWLWELQA